MAQIRNISGRSLTLYEPPGAVTIIDAGGVLDVDDADVAGFVCQSGTWQPVAPAQPQAVPTPVIPVPVPTAPPVTSEGASAPTEQEA